ncbi:MAG: glutamine-hydrolyzing carbamoyl-phosphate synthase small subunit [Bacteroidales bacterium]|nr:glutamine-hydrolyzing carbamoyl-phosphate synthase small subunit [Bacteroidales bacterium]
MEQRVHATLKLENGMEFHGYSFGYAGPCDGEVVFSTAMVGYTESLTDPSYSGQILCITFPLVGCYGVPEDGAEENGVSKFMESDKIYVNGLIVSDYSSNYSHWNAVKSLDQWLKEQKIPGIYGIDTRELTKVLRDNGAMLGIIVPEGQTRDFPVPDPNKENQIAKVSCKEVIRYGNGDKKVVLVDCGVKHNILRCFLNRGIEIIRVPWDYDFNTLEYDGLFISNGPGNPEFCDITVRHIQEAMKKDKPIFGICMGNQLLCRAGGAKTYKLKYGHRSHNQPVRMAGTNKCFITSQNHGYAVDNSTLGAEWEPYFINMNDGTNEGIRHKSKPFFSSQFHPEASSGPTDTEFLFDEFISKL